MVYNIFYWIHVCSCIIWLLAFLGSLFFAWKTGRAFQTGAEQKFMKLERKSTSIGAHIGALGILISGGAMASIPSGPQWGWFSFGAHTWLADKQVIFLIILILVGFSIKRSVAFKKQMKADGGETVGDEARKKWKKAYRTSLVVYMLVIVNTLLAFYKPF